MTTILTQGPCAAAPKGDEELRSLLRHPTTWSVLGWWTLGYGVMSWLVEWASSQLDWTGAMPFAHGLNHMVYAVVWVGAIVVSIALTERFPVTGRGQIGHILLHLVACLAVTVVWAVLAYYICLAIVPGWEPLGVARLLSSTAKNVLFGYGLLVVLVHIIWRIRRYRAQEVAVLRQQRVATEAQLAALKMELQPHFLFNALHSVSALIHSDPNAANDTLVLVSDLLRRSVRTSRVQKVALREELATLQLYTQIEELRFGDRLCLTWDTGPETLGAAVPHMLLQPLAENAIKHGLEVSSSAGRVTVAAKRVGTELHLLIADDGPGVTEVSPRRGAGIGLAITRRRLEELYGDGHSLTLRNGPSGGAEVHVRLPFEPAPAEVEVVTSAPATTREDVHPAAPTTTPPGAPGGARPPATVGATSTSAYNVAGAPDGQRTGTVANAVPRG